MQQSYRAPNVPDNRVNPEFVRDELLNCFESANREFANLLKMQVTDEALKQQVKTFVSTVFQQCGVSYTNPTRQGIEVAIKTCKDNAEKMMGAQGADIIRHHYAEMMKLVNRLP
jgi:hypothetical protein